MRYMVNVTNYNNGSGLAAIALVLNQKMHSDEWESFSKLPVYQQLLHSFAKIYHRPTLTWGGLKNILLDYRHPEDQQIIWMGALRKCLKQSLLSHDSYRDKLFDTFSELLRSYVDNGKSVNVKQGSNVFVSNYAFFKNKRDHLKSMPSWRRRQEEKKLFDKESLYTYWKEKGYSDYCHYLGDHQAKANITLKDLSVLCKTLHLGIVVFDNGLPTVLGQEGNDQLEFITVTCDHRRWQVEVDSKKLFNKHRILSQYGVPRLKKFTFEEIQEDIQSSADVYRRKHRSLLKITPLAEEENLKNLAKQVKKIPRLFTLKEGVIDPLRNAVNKKNIPQLLTFFEFSYDCRNYILARLSDKKDISLLNFILSCHLKFYELRRKRDKNKSHDETDSWEETLQSVLPFAHIPKKDSTLHLAIRRNEISKAVTLIRRLKDIHKKNEYDITPLHLACLMGTPDVVKEMIHHDRAIHERNRLPYTGINLSNKDKNGQTPLHYAAKNPLPGIVEILLEASKTSPRFAAYLTSKDNHGSTPLHTVIYTANNAVLLCFLKHDYLSYLNVNSQNNIGFTPLHIAALIGDVEKVKFLLNAGADMTISANAEAIRREVHLSAQDNLPSILTPLWLALEQKHFNIIPLLIKNYQQMEKTVNSEGKTARQLAAFYGKKDLLDNLVKRFNFVVILQQPTNKGKTLVHEAAQNGQLAILRFLIEQRCDLNKKDADGNIPLHFAAEFGHAEVVRYICEKTKRENEAYSSLVNANNQQTFTGGIKNTFGGFRQFLWHMYGLPNINEKNKRGETPYMLALTKMHMGVIDVIKSFGADSTSVYEYVLDILYERKRNDNTPRHVQVEQDEHRLADLAEKYGEEIVKKTDKQGNNLIHHCVLAMKPRCALILLHALTIAQRKDVAMKKNKAGLTPFALSEQLIKDGIEREQPAGKKKSLTVLRSAKKENKKERLTPAQVAEVKKVQHLILINDERSYARTIKTAIEKTAFHLRWQQDFKSEVMSSSGYRLASGISLTAMPLYQFATTTAMTQNPFLGMEAAASQFFGADVLDKLERGLGLISPYMPAPMQTPTSWVQNLLWLAGWYRHTSSRFATEAVRQTASFALPLMQLEQSYVGSKNYFTHMYGVGIAFYLTEEFLGRQYLGPYLEQYWVSVEDSLKQSSLEVPKLSEIVEMGAQAANEKINAYTGINIKTSISNGYAWTRENIGRIRPPEVVFEQDIAPQLMSEFVTADPEEKIFLQTMMREIYIENSGNPAIALAKLEQFKLCVNYGSIEPICVVLYDEGSQLLQSKGENYGESLAKLFFSNAFYSSDVFEDEMIQVYKSQIVTEANKIAAEKNTEKRVVEIGKLLGDVQQKSINDYSVRTIDAIFMPLLSEQTNQAFVKNAAVELFKKYLNDNVKLEQELDTLLQYINSGELKENTIEVLDEVAKILQGNGIEYTQAMVNLVTSSALFQGDHFTEEQQQAYIASLTEAITDIPTENETRELSVLKEAIDKITKEATLNYSQLFVVNNVLPALNFTDNTVKKYFTEVTTRYVNANLNKDPFLNNKLEDFIWFINENVISENAILAMNEIALQEVANGQAYGNTIAAFVINSQFIKSLHLTSGYLKLVEDKVIASANSANEGSAEQLQNALKQTIIDANDLARSKYVQSFTPAQVVVNYYRNILKKNGIKEEVDGRSAYLTQSLIATNQYQFSNASPQEIENATQFFKTFLNNMQTPAKSSKQEQYAVENYNRITTFFIIEMFASDFYNGVPLSDSNRAILAQYDSIDLRAAFAVYGVDIMLSDTPGYHPMTMYEKFNMYRKVIDAQYARTSSKAEDKIHDVIVDAFMSHTDTAGQYNALPNSHTIDSAANYLTSSSKNAAENRWTDTPEHLTRPIKVERRSGIRRFFNSCGKELVGVGVKIISSYGLGVVVDDKPKASAGVMDMTSGALTGLSFSLGVKPKQEFVLSSPKPQPNQNYHAYAFDPYQASSTNPQITIEKFLPSQSSQLMKELDHAWSYLVEKQFKPSDEIYYFRDFHDAFIRYYYQEEKKPNAPASTTAQGNSKNKSAKKAGGSPHHRDTVVFASETPTPALVTAVVNPKPQSIMSKVGIAILNWAIPPANANPLVMGAVAGQEAGGALAAQQAGKTNTALTSIFEDDNWGWESTEYPIHNDSLFGYFGMDPNDAPSSLKDMSFPLHLSKLYLTQFLVEKLSTDLPSYTFPIANPLLFSPFAFRKSNDGKEPSIKGRIKEAKLPTEGRIRFIPEEGYKPENKLNKGPNGGYYDKFGNEWVKGPSRTAGEPFEWDVQLSSLGKKQLGWIAGGKNHINVSLKGRITHR